MPHQVTTEIALDCPRCGEPEMFCVEAGAWWEVGPGLRYVDAEVAGEPYAAGDDARKCVTCGAHLTDDEAAGMVAEQTPEALDRFAEDVRFGGA